MRKIPTLFKRQFAEGKVSGISNEVTPGMEWVLKGDGIATIKWDGACCAVRNGTFWRRYDAKHGKTPPVCAIPCCDPDPVTGHWPHWVPVEYSDRSSNWFLAAYFNVGGLALDDGTYEAIGPHFRNNPYGLPTDKLVRHGRDIIQYCPRTFDGLREFLGCHNIEGIVFWKDGEPQCKIKRSDFGFSWGAA